MRIVGLRSEIPRLQKISDFVSTVETGLLVGLCSEIPRLQEISDFVSTVETGLF